MTATTIPESISAQIDEMVETKGLDRDELEESFEEALADIEESVGDSVSQEQVIEYAWRTVVTKVTREQSMPGQQYDVLLVGHTGVQNWRIRDEDGEVVGKRPVVVGFGVFQPSPEDPLVKTAVIADSRSDVDVDEFIEAADEPFTVIRTEFNANASDVTNAYRLFLTGNKEIEVEPNGTEIPEDRGQRANIVRNITDEITLDDIGHNLSAVEIGEDGSEYLADFGADFKRIDGSVVDRYQDNEKGHYNYTIIDGTVVDAEELRGTEVSRGDAGTPGLTCWANETQMDYDVGTMGDFYGSLRQNEDGAITMNLIAIDPVVPRWYEQEEPAENRTTHGI